MVNLQHSFYKAKYITLHDLNSEALTQDLTRFVSRYVIFYALNFGISCIGTSVPRLDTREAYPVFHNYKIGWQVKYTKYLTWCKN